MTDSTSIESLPGPSSGNVKLGITEQVPVQQTITNSPINTDMASASIPFAPSAVDPNSLNNVLTGIQRAESQGMTQLPSRDVPMNSANIIQDEQVKANYLPNSEKKGYIEEQDTYNSMMERNRTKEEQNDRLDVIYDEFQLPILIMVLFFIFQLPFVQKKLIGFFPTLFLKDGNMSMGGYLTKTILFGITFYAIMKLTSYASEL